MDELLKRVPKPLRDRFREIVGLTDRYCETHMNAEYRDLCREAAAEACRVKVPVESGKAAGWAAGVVSAVAFANFLGSDPSRPFHTPPDEMAKRLGVSPATMNNKSKAIRDALGIDRADTRFSTKDLNEQNPLNRLPEIFAELMGQLGAPARGRGKPAGKSKRGKKPAKPAGPVKIYTLDVSLLSGPITKAFAKKNKSVVRTIEIRSDQTLEDLHEAIFDAFDRDDPHMYEFQFGKRPMDPKGPRYVMPAVADDDFGPPVAGITTETYIGNLGLKPKRSFGYWFDFGDDWHHQIDVVSISDGPPKGKYPRVTHRIGESPPQYIDWDEEES